MFKVNSATPQTDGNWFSKIKLETIENEDGSLNLLFDWDETDPDLHTWTALGPEKQEEFVLNALKASTTEE